MLRLLALRQCRLLDALEARGHAAQQPLRLERPQEQAWREGQLPEPLHRARAHPEWSALNPGRRDDAASRQEALHRLTQELQA